MATATELVDKLNLAMEDEDFELAKAIKIDLLAILNGLDHKIEIGILNKIIEDLREQNEMLMLRLEESKNEVVTTA